MEIAERLKTVLRKSQDLLNIRNAQRAVTSPPSYDAVLLQKHCERLLQPTGTPLHGVAGYLREFDPLIIPPTPEASEKAVQKHLTALSRVNDASTLEYARRSCGGTRRKAYDRHFAHLLTVYEWSWLHQIADALIDVFEKRSPRNFEIRPIRKLRRQQTSVVMAQQYADSQSEGPVS
ncbi:hypothetical protein EPUS_03722 [Endocarpon pusillum Z07020]|uniref:Uncharacterized protein n=1 Tax=Endocarpon pusillum (strain Z07020 / HMAS-L-300199) TaxID=1263415 RepID=U1HHR2_ENDPU|nr:uncharacterized protein EPUS_03722 [Endocarpon pusillum Z07020]ERF68404.1 hypothetical protein EPUS_03722 [Endocarpon pusillum Z07020]